MTVHEQPTRPAGTPPTWTPPTGPAPTGEPGKAPGKHRAKIAVAGAIVAAAVVGGGGAAGGMMAALHGSYVVSDGNGGYSTELTQTGTVSAVSAGSITVKSADGYSKAYVINGSTSVDNGADAIGDVAAGHTVRVVATSAGNTATATTITDT